MGIFIMPATVQLTNARNIEGNQWTQLIQLRQQPNFEFLLFYQSNRYNMNICFLEENNGTPPEIYETLVEPNKAADKMITDKQLNPTGAKGNVISKNKKGICFLLYKILYYKQYYHNIFPSINSLTYNSVTNGPT